MSRLVAFGCSHTYGEGLKDCWVPEGENIDGIEGPDAGKFPSKYAWPQLLADKLNIECCNLGLPGTSNKFIWHNILNTHLTKKDIVVILWTYHNRTCILKNKNRYQRIMVSDINNPGRPEQERSLAETFYENYYYDYNAIVESVGQINHIKSYLDNINVKNYHLLINTSIKEEAIPEWNQVKLHPIKLRYDLPLAEDNKHPGEEANKILSNKIYTIICQSK